MIGSPRITIALRSLAVLAVGALAVHQLRYLIGYGSEAGAALAQQGHGYLTQAPAALLALALLGIASMLVSARSPVPGAPGLRWRGVAIAVLSYALALLLAYCLQETLEGLLASGHPGGLAAIFAHGGAVALPLSLFFGALAWAASFGLDAIERRLARSPGPIATRDTAPRVLGRPRRSRRVSAALEPLSFGLARRPPPLAAAI